MTKSQIAAVLEEIATLLELKDENPFKIRAYANAARSLETFGGNLADLKDEEALAKIPGIGKAIAAKIKELAATGKLKYLEELRAEFPAAILELFSISGLGAKKIKALYEQLHISSIEQLREACESGKVAELPGFGETTQTKTSVRLRTVIQCDLRVVTSAEYPFALNYFTGSKEHNIEMRSRALQRGWTLNEYRLTKLPPDPKSKAKKRKPAAKIPKVNEEADLYRALGLDFIPPELRENCGEFEAAENHSLPRLIEQENLRGTFHCHTVASDGHNTLEEMAAAAQELGLEYLGIAEHSKSSIQAHGIDADKLRAQIAAIRKLNKTSGGFRIFAGVECDILRDGKLDFDDEILAELDFVVASVHSVFNLSETEMTKRVIRAMENQFVTILAHPTGRLLLKREPYSIDIPEVIDAAAATGTWIEVNAAPKRLDLDWRWWPLAKEKGVKCAINPDAHRTERLQDLWFGVAIARKGWLTKADVVNCLPLGKIEAALQAKREVRSEK